MSVRAAICLSQVVFVGASSCALKYERLRVVQVYAPELTQHISACGVFNYIPTALHVSFVFVIFQNINNTSILIMAVNNVRHIHTLVLAVIYR